MFFLTEYLVFIGNCQLLGVPGCFALLLPFLGHYLRAAIHQLLETFRAIAAVSFPLPGLVPTS